jgi:hypothetical protein
MPKIKNKTKGYVIVAEHNDYTYGAFPYSKDGLQQAKNYLSVLAKKTKEKYLIREV